MLRSSNELEDCTVSATDGPVGHVTDVYFDDDAWVVRYLVVESGAWLSSRHVLISPLSVHHANWQERTLPVSITKDQVGNSPNISADKPVSRQNEMQYFDYYGYPYYWDGGGLWGAGLYPYAMFPDAAGARLDWDERVRSEEIYLRAVRARHRKDDPHLRSCKAVTGYSLHATDGEIGHIDGLIFDEDTWAVRYVVANTSNWWLGHKVLISPQWITGIDWKEERVSVDLTRESIKNAPPYDSSVKLNWQHESGLYEHYGKTGYWAPGAVL